MIHTFTKDTPLQQSYKGHWSIDVSDRDAVAHLNSGVRQSFDRLTIGRSSAIAYDPVEIRNVARIGPFSVIASTVTLPDLRRIGRKSVIAHDCTFGNGLRIAVNCVIGEGCRFGRDTVIGAGAFVGSECVFGDHTEFALPPRILRGRADTAPTEIGDGVKVGNACFMAEGTKVGIFFQAGSGFTLKPRPGYRPTDTDTDTDTDTEFGVGVKLGVHSQLCPKGRVILGDSANIGSSSCVSRATIGKDSLIQGEVLLQDCEIDLRRTRIGPSLVAGSGHVVPEDRSDKGLPLFKARISDNDLRDVIDFLTVSNIKGTTGRQVHIYLTADGQIWVVAGCFYETLEDARQLAQSSARKVAYLPVVETLAKLLIDKHFT